MVIGMTSYVRQWRLRSGLVALSAAVVVATAFGPGPVMATTRLGAGEAIGVVTASAAVPSLLRRESGGGLGEV